MNDSAMLHCGSLNTAAIRPRLCVRKQYVVTHANSPCAGLPCGTGVGAEKYVLQSLGGRPQACASPAGTVLLRAGGGNTDYSAACASWAAVSYALAPGPGTTWEVTVADPARPTDPLVNLVVNIWTTDFLPGCRLYLTTPASNCSESVELRQLLPANTAAGRQKWTLDAASGTLRVLSQVGGGGWVSLPAAWQQHQQQRLQHFLCHMQQLSSCPPLAGLQLPPGSPPTPHPPRPPPWRAGHAV